MLHFFFVLVYNSLLTANAWLLAAPRRDAILIFLLIIWMLRNDSRVFGEIISLNYKFSFFVFFWFVICKNLTNWIQDGIEYLRKSSQRLPDIACIWCYEFCVNLSSFTALFQGPYRRCKRYKNGKKYMFKCQFWWGLILNINKLVKIYSLLIFYTYFSNKYAFPVLPWKFWL